MGVLAVWCWFGQAQEAGVDGLDHAGEVVEIHWLDDVGARVVGVAVVNVGRVS